MARPPAVSDRALTELGLIDAERNSVSLSDVERYTLQASILNGSLTLSGNEITDALRALNVQGDGLSNDSSCGIWQAVTNQVNNGGFETNATGWDRNVIESGLSVARDTSTSKFGSASLLVTTPGTVDQEGCYYTPEDHLAVGGQAYVIGCWVKAPNGATLRLRVATAGVGVAFFTNFVGTGSWQRVTTSGNCLGAGPQSLSPGVITNGVQAISFNVDGVQVEPGSVATPYVHTNGATASRGTGSVRAPAMLLDPAQGWIALRVRMGWPRSAGPGYRAGFFSWEKDGSNYLFMWADSASGMGLGDQVGAPSHNAFVGNSWNAGDIVTVIGRWDAANLYFSVGGAAFVSTTRAAALPTGMSSLFEIGDYSRYARSIDSDVLWAAAGVGTLSNGDATTLNASGNTDPTLGQFPRDAFATAVWKAVDSTYQTPGVSLPRPYETVLLSETALTDLAIADIPGD